MSTAPTFAPPAGLADLITRARRESFQHLVSRHDNARYTGGPRLGPISLVVWHCTANDRAEEAEAYLNRERSDHPASYNYVVAKDGRIIRMAPATVVADHAGDSAWPLRTAGPRQGGSVNRISVGVSFANDDGSDDDPSDDALTPAQILSGLWLARILSESNGLRPAQHVGHREVSPIRKTDPTPGVLPMPWWREQIAAVLAR